MNKIYKHKFSDLYDLSSGISTSKGQAGHGAPFVSFGTVFNNYFMPEDLSDLMDTTAEEQNTYSVRKNDVFVTRTSETIDELAMSCVALKDYPEATYSGFTKRLRPKKENEVYAKYIGFYLRGDYFRKTITNNAFMTLRASFNEDIFSFLDLYLPDYDEQVKIGDLLYLFEKKISLNKKINDNLQKTIQTMYDYWFTQFDFPDEYGNPYRSSEGKMIWNEDVKKEIPEGWKVSYVSDNELFSIIKPGIDIFDGEKIYLATGDVNGVLISSGSLITFDNREGRANMQPACNSVWFAKMKNSVKHIFVNKELSHIIEHAILSTGFCGLLCKESAFEYVSAFIHNPLFEMKKDGLAHGATQEAVNNDDIKGISILIPSERVVTSFHEQTKAYYQKISKNIMENRQLASLREWLLPMLMNGQATIVD